MDTAGPAIDVRDDSGPKTYVCSACEKLYPLLKNLGTVYTGIREEFPMVRDKRGYRERRQEEVPQAGEDRRAGGDRRAGVGRRWGRERRSTPDRRLGLEIRSGTDRRQPTDASPAWTGVEKRFQGERRGVPDRDRGPEGTLPSFARTPWFPVTAPLDTAGPAIDVRDDSGPKTYVCSACEKLYPLLKNLGTVYTGIREEFPMVRDKRGYRERRQEEVPQAGEDRRAGGDRRAGVGRRWGRERRSTPDRRLGLEIRSGTDRRQANDLPLSTRAIV